MKVFEFVSICVLVTASVGRAAPSVQDNKIENDNAVDGSGGSSRGLAARFLGSCFESSDVSTCLAVKSITALNRAARANNIVLMDGVTFKRDPISVLPRLARAMNENDVYAQLPENSSERSDRLISMALQSATDFFSSHNLEIKLPQDTTQKLSRALEEGRGKMKKMMNPLLMAVGAKLFAVLPLMLGALALLVGKAVITAKVALVAAILVAATRLFGGLSSKTHTSMGAGYGASVGWSAPTNAGWSGQASNSYPYARSLNEDQMPEKDDIDGQQLAYAEQLKTAQQ